MTIEEAKQFSIKTGEKISHRFFLPEEWVQVFPNDTLITEDARYSAIPFGWFMEQRTNSAWNKDWFVWRKH